MLLFLSIRSYLKHVMTNDIYHLRPTGFGPFHVENQVIVTVSIQRCNSFGGIILFVVMNESKTLALTSLLVLGKIYPGNMSKWLEQFLQISFLRTFGKIRHPDSGSVFICKNGTFDVKTTCSTFNRSDLAKIS